MSKNDRFVVRHPEGWAVKKAGADRASSIHNRQADAERAAKADRQRFGGRGSPGSGPGRALARLGYGCTRQRSVPAP